MWFKHRANVGGAGRWRDTAGAGDPLPPRPDTEENNRQYKESQKQRRLEREIRKAKEEAVAYDLAAEQATDPAVADALRKKAEEARLRVGSLQEQMREHVKENDFLVRQPKREKDYLSRARPIAGLRSGSSRERSRERARWENDEVSRLSSPDEIAKYIESHHGITADDSFRALSLDTQRATAAGFDRASELYGPSGGGRVGALSARSSLDGEYSYMTGTIRIHDKADGYLTGMHEYVHMLDGERSSGMPGFLETSDESAYNLYSRNVVDESRRTLGIRTSSRAYSDQLAEIFRYDPGLVDRYRNNPGEIAAYAIEHVEAHGGNDLSREIARRFSEDAETA